MTGNKSLRRTVLLATFVLFTLSAGLPVCHAKPADQKSAKGAPPTDPAAGDVPETEADFSTPEGAYAAYSEASKSGDAAAIRATCIHSAATEKEIVASAAYETAENKLRAAVKAKWGEDGEKVFFQGDPGKLPDGYSFKVTGDKAVLANDAKPPIVLSYLKRVKDKWQVDLTAEPAAHRDRNVKGVNAMGKAIKAFADKLPQAKYKTAAEANEAYTESVLGAFDAAEGGGRK